VRLLDRLVTALCALALVASAAVPCAGWKAAQEERKDCCASHCPMEGGGSHDSAPSPATDGEADACCFLSEPRDAEAAPNGPGAVVVLIETDSPVAPASHESQPDIWRAAAPFPIRSVSPHLLHSVLLV
jgi:hypothetical protein